VRGLQPIRPSAVTVTQDDQTLAPRYRATLVGGAQRDIPADRMHHVRGAARDFLEGDSPVLDVREAIAHEIALERHGASLFGNGAFPFLLFNIAQGFKGFVDKKEEEAFIASIKSLSGGRRAHSGFFMPKGIEAKEILTPNDQAQFIESRKHQRTVIAAAFGVPPHLVGDLERATFNNVEQQDTDFVINVVMPIAQAFESAMERDLLTDEDRRSGVIVRFNLDAVQRADFKSRQEGLQIQRQNGAINANEWREADGRNPIAEKDGGEEYIRPANMQRAGEVPPNGSNGAPSSPRDQRGGAQDPPN
jgi:HK97 family phage portal protein